MFAELPVLIGHTPDLNLATHPWRRLQLSDGSYQLMLWKEGDRKSEKDECKEGRASQAFVYQQYIFIIGWFLVLPLCNCDIAPFCYGSLDMTSDAAGLCSISNAPGAGSAWRGCQGAWWLRGLCQQYKEHKKAKAKPSKVDTGPNHIESPKSGKNDADCCMLCNSRYIAIGKLNLQTAYSLPFKYSDHNILQLY